MEFVESFDVRVEEAVKKYMQFSNADVHYIGEIDNFLVFESPDLIIFVAWNYGLGYFKEYSRITLINKFDETLPSFFASNEAADIQLDTQIRVDMCQVSVIGTDRAVIKHTPNAINYKED